MGFSSKHTIAKRVPNRYCSLLANEAVLVVTAAVNLAA